MALIGILAAVMKEPIAARVVRFRYTGNDCRMRIACESEWPISMVTISHQAGNTF